MYRRSIPDLIIILRKQLRGLKRDKNAHPSVIALYERGLHKLENPTPLRVMPDAELAQSVESYRQDHDPERLNELLQQLEDTTYKAVRKEGWLQKEFVHGSDDWTEAMQLGRRVAIDAVVGFPDTDASTVKPWEPTSGVPLRAYVYEMTRFRLKDLLRKKRRCEEQHVAVDTAPKRDPYTGSDIPAFTPRQLQSPSAEQEAEAEDLIAFAQGVVAALDAAGHKSLAAGAAKGHQWAIDRTIRMGTAHV
jgi:hypothetical protein